jgi:hypothetical protein
MTFQQRILRESLWGYGCPRPENPQDNLEALILALKFREEMPELVASGVISEQEGVKACAVARHLLIYDNDMLGFLPHYFDYSRLSLDSWLWIMKSANWETMKGLIRILPAHILEGLVEGDLSLFYGETMECLEQRTDIFGGIPLSWYLFLVGAKPQPTLESI